MERTLTESELLQLLLRQSKMPSLFNRLNQSRTLLQTSSSEQVFYWSMNVDAQREDLEDESHSFTDSAEDIDEEDEEMGLSDEMKGVYSRILEIYFLVSWAVVF